MQNIRTAAEWDMLCLYGFISVSPHCWVWRESEMKFGKSLRSEISESLPGWEGKFLSYKELKKQLKLTATSRKETKRCTKRQRLLHENLLGAGVINANIMREKNGFMQLLDSELEKVSTFFTEKEEEHIIRMKELKDRVASLKCIEDKTQVKKDILEFHREMVWLLHYSIHNFAGLMKILKKHNKKNSAIDCFALVPGVLQQPFFTNGLICNLLKECEAMLSQLFRPNDP